VRTSRRLEPATQAAPEVDSQLQEYSDGFGRTLQVRADAEGVQFGASGTEVGLTSNLNDTPDAAVAVAVPDQVRVSAWEVQDSKGRVVTIYPPFFSTGWDYEPVSDHSDDRATRLFYDPVDRLTRKVEPNGAATRWVFGVPRALDRPELFDPSPWEITLYDAVDCGTNDALATASAHPQAHTPTSEILDGLGRTIARVERLGPDSHHEAILQRFGYDLRGNLLQATDGCGRLALRNTWDLLDRAIESWNLDRGRRWAIFDAVGNLVETTFPGGQIEARIYDRLNRLNQIWVQEGDACARLVEHYSYGDGSDPHQKEEERAQARARARLGRLQSVHDGAGSVTFERYDLMGNVLTETRHTVSDRALSEGWRPDWSTPESVAVLDDSAHESDFEFDALNRLVLARRPVGADGRRAVEVREYGSGGLLSRILLDGKEYLTFAAYNARGQRILTEYGNGVMTHCLYDPDTTKVLRLRSVRRLTAGRDPLEWRGQGAALQDVTYCYDAVGNVVRTQERIPGCGTVSSGRPDELTRSFCYDALYRLISADGRTARPTGAPWMSIDIGSPTMTVSPRSPRTAAELTEMYTETIEYDVVGNLIQVRRTSAGRTSVIDFGLDCTAGSAVPRSNRLVFVTRAGRKEEYAYDDRGNLVRQNTERCFTWDHADRLIAFEVCPEGATTASQRARYLYGFHGQRVKKWVQKNGAGPGQSTTYIAGGYEDFVDHSGSARTTHVHLTDGDERLAMIRQGPGLTAGIPPVQYTFRDAVGSTSTVVDQNAGWVNREEFDAHGNTVFGGYAHKRYRFGGRERDEETSFQYHGGRYLAPGLGRWISCDPAGPVDGSNLYEYARSNPLRFQDPSGLKAREQCLGECTFPDGETFIAPPLQEGADEGSPAGGAPSPKGTDGGAPKNSPPISDRPTGPDSALDRAQRPVTGAPGTIDLRPPLGADYAAADLSVGLRGPGFVTVSVALDRSGNIYTSLGLGLSPTSTKGAVSGGARLGYVSTLPGVQERRITAEEVGTMLQGHAATVTGTVPGLPVSIGVSKSPGNDLFATEFGITSSPGWSVAYSYTTSLSELYREIAAAVDQGVRSMSPGPSTPRSAWGMR
jgi:RHS repeat-associated protein